MPTELMLDEVKKSVYDLKKAVDEKLVPQEKLLEMVNDAVKTQMGAAQTPGDDHKYDVIPEPKSLINRFDIKSDPNRRVVDQILLADNVQKDIFGRPKIARDPMTGEKALIYKDERMAELHAAADDLAIIHACMLAAGPTEYKQLAHKNEFEAIKSLKSYQRWDRLTEGLKSQLDSTTSGGADEWVPTLWSTQLTDAITLAHVVAALFPMIPMPSEPFTIPTQTAKPMASVVSEGAAASSTSFGAGKPTTAQKSLSTKIFKYFLDFTDEVAEDSIIALVPFIRQWIVMGLVRGEEYMIINGDSDGTHFDSDTQAASAEHPAKAFDGLRKFGSSNTYATGNPDPFTSAAIRNTRALLSVGFRENPADLVYITSGLGMLNMLQIPEILTLDKVGPSATILNGMLASFDGSPVILSEHVREDLASTGYYAAASSTTIIICAHRASFVRGSRRDPRVETDKNIKTSVNTMAVSMRRGFLDLQDSTTFNNVAVAINIS